MNRPVRISLQFPSLTSTLLAQTAKSVVRLAAPTLLSRRARWGLSDPRLVRNRVFVTYGLVRSFWIVLFVVRNKKIYLVVLENSSYEDVVGQAYMPFWNSMAAQYVIAMNYFADAHPSLSNYFVLTTGQIITKDDNFNGVVDADNLVRELKAVGRSWRVYAEGLPALGYLGPDVYPYIKHHNPFAYFRDVVI